MARNARRSPRLARCLRAGDRARSACWPVRRIPDGTDAFFQSFQHTLNQALPGSLSIITPFAEMTKTEVLQRGAHLPLGSTFSCINPSHSQHCGECNKCEERRQAFHKAKLHDPTNYINNPL